MNFAKEGFVFVLIVGGCLLLGDSVNFRELMGLCALIAAGCILFKTD